jgi:hypothetical protein
MGRENEGVNPKIIKPEKDAYRRLIIELSTKCTLILYESEIWQLPEDVLKRAIQRGKARKRALQAEKR